MVIIIRLLQKEREKKREYRDYQLERKKEKERKREITTIR